MDLLIEDFSKTFEIIKPTINPKIIRTIFCIVKNSIITVFWLKKSLHLEFCINSFINKFRAN